MLGAGISAIVLAADSILGRRASTFRLHLMPIAVGLYLPFGLAVPIFVGGLIEWLGRRKAGVSAASEARRPRGFSRCWPSSKPGAEDPARPSAPC